jgi:hypothetical protein
MTKKLDDLLIEEHTDQKHVIRVVDPSGDLKFTWDAENADEVAAIEDMFNEKMKKKWIAYSVKRSGKKGIVIKTFDPDAEKIILAPPMVGG